MDGASREATRHARVLLVDDDPDIRDFIELRIFRDREEAGLTEPCIVFLTAKAMETDRELGFEVGADEYLIKPFDPIEAANAVDAALARTAERRRGLADRRSYAI